MTQANGTPAGNIPADDVVTASAVTGDPAEHEPGDEAVVRALLRHAGLRPEETEVAAITAAYPHVRQMARSLYEVPGAASEVPATTFDARWPADA